MEKFNRLESAQNIHASRDQCHVHVHQFWWAWSLWFWRYGYLSKTAKFPFRGMDYSPWSSKNSIDRNQLKKFMQVGIDVKCMHTNFGGRGLSGFRDKISLWSIKVEKFNRSESAKKIHASRDQCHVHVHQFWWACSLWFERYGYLSKTAKFPFRGMDYCCHKNEHKQGRVGLQAISVTPRPQPYTAVICRSMMQDSMLQRLS